MSYSIVSKSHIPCFLDAHVRLQYASKTGYYTVSLAVSYRMGNKSASEAS